MEATLDLTPGPGLTLVVGRNGDPLEGERGACSLAREWADGADLTGASTWAQVHGQPRTGPEALGWETPLEAYRPFLSYNELGSLLDEGPSKLYGRPLQGPRS